MTDRKAVMSWLEGLAQDDWPVWHSDSEVQETAKSALELLKEQEAKQIVRKQCRKEYDDGSIEYFAEWYCPHCNSLILRGFGNPSIKFCYKCGKPVLWEGR